MSALEIVFWAGAGLLGFGGVVLAGLLVAHWRVARGLRRDRGEFDPDGGPLGRIVRLGREVRAEQKHAAAPRRHLRNAGAAPDPFRRRELATLAQRISAANATAGGAGAPTHHQPQEEEKRKGTNDEPSSVTHPTQQSHADYPARPAGGG